MNTIRFVLAEMLLSWANSLYPVGSYHRISLRQARREHYDRVRSMEVWLQKSAGGDTAPSTATEVAQ